jgi:hypothetical protein
MSDSHTNRAHATLGASSASRWIACPGSVRLSEGIPNTTSSFAQEGTAAHELAEHCLRQGKEAIEFLGEEFEEVEVTEEMAEAVQVYVDEVRRVAEGNLLVIEQRFSLDDLKPPVPMFGTADAVIWDEKNSVLTVMDLKYGAGVPVKVTNSPQLSYYALGAMLAMAKEHNVFPTKIRMVIVQPRYRHEDGPIRYFETDSYTLRMEWAEDLLAAAHETLNPDAALMTGDHCRFCPAQAKCPLIHQQAVALAQSDFDDNFSPPVPETLSDQQLSGILSKASELVAWVNAVKAYAQHKLEKGGSVPGFKLVARRAQRSWIDAESTEQALQNLGLTEDEMYVRKLLSPAQAEGIFGKKKAVKDKLAPLIQSISSGNTIAPVTDRRTAVVIQIGDEFDNPLALEHEAFQNYE